jgi:hypothetical protein
MPLRAEQMTVEFQTVSAAGDTAAIDRLAAEARNDGELRAALPPDVASALQDASRVAAEAEQQRRVDALAAQILSANSTSDAGIMSSLAASWRELERGMNGSFPTDIAAVRSLVEQWEAKERSRLDAEESARLRDVFLASGNPCPPPPRTPRRKRRWAFAVISVCVCFIGAYLAVNADGRGKMGKLYHAAKNAIFREN